MCTDSDGAEVWEEDPRYIAAFKCLGVVESSRRRHDHVLSSVLKSCWLHPHAGRWISPLAMSTKETLCERLMTTAGWWEALRLKICRGSTRLQRIGCLLGTSPAGGLLLALSAVLPVASPSLPFHRTSTLMSF